MKKTYNTMNSVKTPQVLRSSRIKRFLFLYIILAVILLSFFLGMGYGKSLMKKTYEGRVVIGDQEIPGYLQQNVNFDLFWHVWGRVQKDFYKQPVMDTQLFYGAIEGLVASLDDPYSTFMNPELTAEFTDDINGTFEGIGAEIGFRDQLLTIISPLPSSPAEQSGIEAGDIVVRIDGEDSYDLSLFEAVRRIKGPKGTQVTLEILREGENDTREISITRDTIYIESLTYEMRSDGIGYIKIADFHVDTESLLKQAFKEFSKQEVKGIVIDVRNNPGGFMQSAIDIASYWIEKDKVVVQQRNSDGTVEEYYSSGPGNWSDIPSVVLINTGSASASEILAGAFQDYEISTIMGQESFGKGSVQTFDELPGGSSLKITIAEWLTPNARAIHDIGITPDEEVVPSEEDREADRDIQLERAVEFLLGQ